MKFLKWSVLSLSIFYSLINQESNWHFKYENNKQHISVLSLRYVDHEKNVKSKFKATAYVELLLYIEDP
jgi:hypothetical protein